MDYKKLINKAKKLRQDTFLAFIKKNAAKPLSKEQFRSMDLKETLKYLDINYLDLPKMMVNMRDLFKLKLFKQDLVKGMDKVLLHLQEDYHSYLRKVQRPALQCNPKNSLFFLRSIQLDFVIHY